MDTLAAKDQENFVHNLQAAAASKPLNAGLKGLHAKTPGNKLPKTPFKVPLNDENAFGKGGKSVLQTKGKGNENLLMTVKKDGKLDSNAFLTPAGPRTRAPLGMKTTNAKAKAFQTPAPLSGSAKTQKASPRLRRPKVKVLQQEVQNTEEDDVPEIEYMPPKEIPLLNDMDDYLPRDWKIPKLENGGVWEAYHNPLEDDGRTKLQREFEEGLERDTKKNNEEFDKQFEQQWERDQAEAARYMGAEIPKKATPKNTIKAADVKKRTTGPSTLKARSAAAALAEPRKHAFAAPTAATKSRLPSKVVSSKKPIIDPSATRHAAATAASKSTIGYAQGRSPATRIAARKPLSNVTKPAPFSVTSRPPPTASSTHNRNASVSSIASKPRGPFSRSSSTSTNATLVAPQEEQPYRTAEDVERELELMLLRDDDEDDEAWANSFSSQLGGGDPFDEDLDGFQLELPEGL
ncbi:hypothetical protein N0V90_002971 [Kalmusia sp. IMI 367209]|nr:hypothetical protein N0V90_002971 [Kalmusia sp. IMI 367209]